MIEPRAGRLHVCAAMRMGNARNLLQQGNALIGPAEVVFDFSAVTEADSSALAVMLGWLRQAEILRSTVRFAGIPAGVLELAKIYGVAELLPQV